MERLNLAVHRPLIRGESFTLSALADTYMAGYKALDPYFGSRLQFFVELLGNKTASDIDSNDVQDCLDVLCQRGKLHNRGGTKVGGEMAKRSTSHLPLPPSIVTEPHFKLFLLGRERNASCLRDGSTP